LNSFVVFNRTGRSSCFTENQVRDPRSISGPIADDYVILCRSLHTILEREGFAASADAYFGERPDVRGSQPSRTPAVDSIQDRRQFCLQSESSPRKEQDGV